ncbi:hypothetical protein ACGFK1_09785 [Mycobacterium sp. NPDC048908]|uniref:hypothetical protein n=1 Tax=Mycobacterium sp. NPDC048908 TaxID=3364292 RepID=UPI00371741C1
MALIAAVATGLFRWLKRELGDHTREDLTSVVTELIDHGRTGYERGRRTVVRGSELYERGRDRLTRNDSGHRDDDPNTPEEPLTGPPVPGRPPPAAHPRVAGATARRESPRTASMCSRRRWPDEFGKGSSPDRDNAGEWRRRAAARLGGQGPSARL